MRCFLLFGTALLLAQPAAHAQVGSRPAAAPAAPADRYTAGLGTAHTACREAHLQGARATRRPTTDSRRHERLMNRYDVGNARLDLALERTSNAIGAGSNVLTWARNVSATTPLDTLGFELNNSLILDSLLVNGQRVPPARIAWLPGGVVQARPVQPVAAGARFSYHAYYHGVPGATGGSFFGQGITSQTNNTYGNRVTWTLSSPFATSDWCPSKQVLSDKLDSVEVRVTTSATNKVGSNGRLLGVVPLPGGKVRYEWKSRYPIAYYLVSVAVGEYIDYTLYAHPANLPTPADSIPIINYLYANPQALATMKTDIDDTPAMIENFSEKLGLYPFWREKYGHCTAPIGGGMEHQTMTTMLGFNFILTSHELCHQWFGDHVTCRSYRDIWLNEGFATYGEYLSIEALAPAGTTLQWLNGYRPGGFQFTGSVVVPAADTLDVTRIFSSELTYAKGGLVIHMLRHVVNNDSAFFAALRTYQQQYGGSTATTANLRASLEGSLGLPLGWFFDQWLYGEGFARTNVRWNQVGTDLLIESAQVATAPTSVPFFRMPLEFDYAVAGQPATTLRLEQTQPTQFWTVPLPAGTTVATLSTDPRKWNLMQVLRQRRDNTLGVTGRAAELAATRLAVYPNPCTDFLVVPPAPGVRTAEICDLAGRVVRRTALPATTEHLPTADLAAGTYLLRLTAAGQPTQLGRFNKQ